MSREWLTTIEQAAMQAQQINPYQAQMGPQALNYSATCSDCQKPVLQLFGSERRCGGCYAQANAMQSLTTEARVTQWYLANTGAALSLTDPAGEVKRLLSRVADLERALAVASKQNIDANTALAGWTSHNADQERAIAALREAMDLQSKTIQQLRAQMSDPPQSDNPDAPPNRGVVDQAIDALDKRLVGRTDRVRLRGALDKADGPLTGRAASDEALGRIARLGVMQGRVAPFESA